MRSFPLQETRLRKRSLLLSVLRLIILAETAIKQPTAANEYIIFKAWVYAAAGSFIRRGLLLPHIGRAMKTRRDGMLCVMRQQRYKTRP